MKDECNSLSRTIEFLPSMAALQIFERAAERESFVAAAKDLDRTPSAVSHAIKELEGRLGVSLFDRIGRSIRLTTAGADYLDMVQKSLTQLRIATRNLRQYGNTNIIRISALPFFTSTVLLPNLTRFESDFPDLDLRIETSNNYADILNGEADIAIRFGTEQSQGLASIPLVAVTGRPVASPEYLSSSPALEHPKDLQEHTIIHVRQNPSAWQNWYGSETGGEIQARKNLTFDSILGALDAVQRGVGIALAMHPLIQDYPQYGHSIVPVLKTTADESVYYNFICQKPALGDQKINKTLGWLKASLGLQTND